VSSIERIPRRPGPGPWAAVVMVACALLVPTVGRAQSAATGTRGTVRVVTDASGSRLQVDGRDFMVYGMNWDYVPIGQNYNYSLWSQPDDVIEAALAREMPLLQAMGVNTIRQYVGIPPRWVRYIYERYGIYTVINHTVGRYGFNLDGVWYPSVDYSNPKMRAAIKAEVLRYVDEFRGVPGVLMWLLGNENNYGLVWKSAEVEALPQGERDAARARYLYSLFGEVIRGVKEHDPGVTVAMANGDVQYADLIAEECKGLDVFGTNCYRGISARDLFQVVHDKLGLPVMFTEFGADAFNAREMREDQATQARYLLGQWEEIYEQSAGKGRVGDAIGGIVFQWADGWWKFGQESRLDVHDTNASWPNGGYAEDYVPGENNMNEEWWGICAKGFPDARGLFDLHPRAAYYALKDAWTLPAYAPGTDLAAIRAHFARVTPAFAALQARGDAAGLITETLQRVRVSGLRLQLETYNTGANRTTTPGSSSPQEALPSFKGFDRLESFYVDVQAQPAGNVTGTLSLNVLGHVPGNPMDEIFYEKRGRSRTVEGPDGSFELDGIERTKVYRSTISWDDRWFLLDGFYRTGHFHWGYEGDFFGLYREANYGPNLDTYGADAPIGVEMTGKRGLRGLKVAFGPQLWWGANPAVLVKYNHRLGDLDATAIYQDDITRQSTVSSSVAVPQPPTRKATLDVKTTRGPAAIEMGAIWSGSTKSGDPFQVAARSGDGWEILRDHVMDSDALGGKFKLGVEQGRFRWYVQGAAMGLVADGGPTSTLTFTGWNLKDSGSGNQTNLLSGFTWNTGNFQFGPNFLWQRPIVGPMPSNLPSTSPGRLRNVLDDPFAVRGNRETVGGELMITYDPTPATWLWAWDNDVREDARLAGSLGLVVRHLPTSQDASIFIAEDGVTTYAFSSSPPPRRWCPSHGDFGLWELNARTISRIGADLRVVGHAYVGNGESNGNDATGVGDRVVRRYGADTRIGWGATAFTAYVKANDWGPYDYHRDFNLTYPLQLMADLSRTLGSPAWLDRQATQTRVGMRATWRSLDSHSPRYVASSDDDADDPPHGSEWEIRTYLIVSI
jgi:beta-galactosidase